MLQYNKKILTGSTHITSHDTLLKLTSDIEATFIGVLCLANKVNKTFTFIKEGAYYKARLLLSEEDLAYLQGSSLYLQVTNGYLTQSTNTITLSFNISKIKQGIKISISEEIRDIKIDFAKLRAELNTILDKVPSITIAENQILNPNSIMPGMIPVAIDSKGRCLFQHPFIDHVTEINGQKTLNNAILITAKDIPIEQTDVESAIKAHTEAIKELNSYLNTLSSSLKQVTNKVATIEQQLLQHTDSSII